MSTIIQYLTEPPAGPTHVYDDDEGRLVEAYARAGNGFVRLFDLSEGMATIHQEKQGSIEDVLAAHGWELATDVPTETR